MYSYLYKVSGDPQNLPSFPTLRVSELATDLFVHPAGKECRGHFQPLTYPAHGNTALPAVRHELHLTRKIAQQLVQRTPVLNAYSHPSRLPSPSTTPYLSPPKLHFLPSC